METTTSTTNRSSATDTKQLSISLPSTPGKSTDSKTEAPKPESEDAAEQQIPLSSYSQTLNRFLARFNRLLADRVASDPPQLLIRPTGKDGEARLLLASYVSAALCKMLRYRPIAICLPTARALLSSAPSTPVAGTSATAAKPATPTAGARPFADWDVFADISVPSAIGAAVSAGGTSAAPAHVPATPLYFYSILQNIRNYLIPRAKNTLFPSVSPDRIRANAPLYREFIKSGCVARFVEVLVWLVRVRLQLTVPQSQSTPASNGTGLEQPWFVDEKQTPSHATLIRFLAAEQQRLIARHNAIPSDATPNAPTTAISPLSARAAAASASVGVLPIAVRHGTASLGLELVLLLDSTLCEVTKLCVRLSASEMNAIQHAMGDGSKVTTATLPPSVMSNLFADNIWPLFAQGSNPVGLLSYMPMEFVNLLGYVTKTSFLCYTSFDSLSRDEANAAAQKKSQRAKEKEERGMYHFLWTSAHTGSNSFGVWL